MAGSTAERLYFVEGYGTVTPQHMFLTFLLGNLVNAKRWQDLEVGEETIMVGTHKPIKGRFYNVRRVVTNVETELPDPEWWEDPSP